RSQSADFRRTAVTESGGQGTRHAAHPTLAAGLLRGTRTPARRHRTLRTALPHGDATHARHRSPHGTRSAPLASPDIDPAPGPRTGGLRPRRGPRVRLVSDTAHAHPPLRSHRDGRADLSGRL